MQKKWIYKSPQTDVVNDIAEKMDVSRAFAAVLVNRGVTSAVDAKAFFECDVKNLISPYLLPDIEKTVSRIREAVDKKEKILIYGDRDVDGVTSVCIIYKTLKSLGAEIVWYVPLDEGYGMHKEVIERYHKEGVSLIITVDCGITAVNEAQYIKSLGIDLIITDHHEPSPDGLPEAVAVVDPKRFDSKYPFSELAGCAVSFKVSEAVMMSFGKYFNKEIAALGIMETEDGIEASITVSKNDLIINSFSRTIRGDGDQKKLLGFIGDRCLVVSNREAIETLFKKHFNFELKNKIIEIFHAGAYIQADEVLKAFYNKEYADDIRMRFFMEDNLDLAALGTIADIMPLINENRIIVKEGLRLLGNSSKPGVQAIIERCSRTNNGNTLSAKNISWNVTPVLNAAGRRGKAGLAVELILAKKPYRANELLDQIIELNDQRRDLQSENLEKFMVLVEEQCDIVNDKLLM
ncbi:MAG: DHH family phosphoesterase, partial [bacterium]